MLGSHWCGQDTLLCQTASSAMGVNSQKSLSVSWGNVLIECSFINLPINWVSTAAGLQGLLTVSLLASALWSCAATLERLQVWFHTLKGSKGCAMSLGLVARLCLSQHGRTHMDLSWSAGVKLCLQSLPKLGALCWGPHPSRVVETFVLLL